MRLRRTTEHENERNGRSVVQAFAAGRLLGGRDLLVRTTIPQNRLTRAGKGTTFCHTWKQEGRVTVSVTDLRRSNRLPWRHYADPVERGCRLDVHQATVVACLLAVRTDGKVHKQMRNFGTTTRELLGLRNWLLSESCTHVAMESPGVYWKPVYAVLEGEVEEHNRFLLTCPHSSRTASYDTFCVRVCG